MHICVMCHSDIDLTQLIYNLLPRRSNLIADRS